MTTPAQFVSEISGETFQNIKILNKLLIGAKTGEERRHIADDIQKAKDAWWAKCKPLFVKQQ